MSKFHLVLSCPFISFKSCGQHSSSADRCRRDVTLHIARLAVGLLLDLVTTSRANLALLSKSQPACDDLFGSYLLACGDFGIQVRVT